MEKRYKKWLVEMGKYLMEESLIADQKELVINWLKTLLLMEKGILEL